MLNKKWVGIIAMVLAIVSCEDEKLKGFEKTDYELANTKFQEATSQAEYEAALAAFKKLGSEGKVGEGFCYLVLDNPASAITAFAAAPNDTGSTELPKRLRALDKYAGWAWALYSTAATPTEKADAAAKAETVLRLDPNYTAVVDNRVDKNDVLLVAGTMYLEINDITSCIRAIKRVDPSFKGTTQQDCLDKISSLSTVGLLQ